MRALNHEHLFSFPLRDDNGFDLDGITPGLRMAAREMASRLSPPATRTLLLSVRAERIRFIR